MKFKSCQHPLCSFLLCVLISVLIVVPLLIGDTFSQVLALGAVAACMWIWRELRRQGK